MRQGVTTPMIGTSGRFGMLLRAQSASRHAAFAFDDVAHVERHGQALVIERIPDVGIDSVYHTVELFELVRDRTVAGNFLRVRLRAPRDRFA